MDSFKKFEVTEIKDNPFKLIGRDWMLITAGNIEKFNTMTASWGALGVLWNKNTSTVYVRPTRYTYKFLENNDYYTLSFFPEKYRSALNFCGANSGKDINKVKKTGLCPLKGEFGVYFNEARLVFECKKLFYSELAPERLIDKSLDEANYPNKDYHRMYIGEILNCLVKE